MSKSISLNGDWFLRWSDGERGGIVGRLLVENPDLSRAIQAQVPGEVHLDLIRAGILDEPTTGLSSLSARWVEETLWFYYRTFEAPSLQPGEHAFLYFGGLDLVATIYLNGKQIGKHANAFYPCLVEVTQALREGRNQLVVALDSGLYSIGDRPASGYGMTLNGHLHKRNWLRKTQSSFSWDWSPRLVNVGIHGEVNLQIFSTARYDNFVPLVELSKDLTR